MDVKRFAAWMGSAERGQALPRSYAEHWPPYPAHLTTSERGAADISRASPPAADPLAAGFLACGCGVLAGWLAGWLACDLWLARLAGSAAILALGCQRHVYMSLAVGLLALQYSDRLDGSLAC